MFFSNRSLNLPQGNQHMVIGIIIIISFKKNAKMRMQTKNTNHFFGHLNELHSVKILFYFFFGHFANLKVKDSARTIHVTSVKDLEY